MQENGEEKKLSATKKIAGTAVFTALAFILSFLEIPLFPAAPFLKLDFSLAALMLAAFIYGPVSGASACALKELLCALKSSTGGVGEIANAVVSLGFILLPSIVYVYKKGLKTVIISLVAACFIQVALSLFANRYINFPLYMGANAREMFLSLYPYIIAFNFIKSVSVSVITILLYKRVSGFIKKI